MKLASLLGLALLVMTAALAQPPNPDSQYRLGPDSLAQDGRLIRSREGARIVAIGDQRIAVFEAKTGRRLAQMANNGVQWFGHGLSHPSRLRVVMGTVVGPTDGSVLDYALSISSDGETVQSEPLRAAVFFGSAIGITPKCNALMVATAGEPTVRHIQRRELGAGRLGEPSELQPSTSNEYGVRMLASFGKAFSTRDALEAKLNPFTAAGCPALALGDGFEAGAQTSRGAQVAMLEPGLAFENANRWTATHVGETPAPSAHLPTCTEARPCPTLATVRRLPICLAAYPWPPAIRPNRHLRRAGPEKARQAMHPSTSNTTHSTQALNSWMASPPFGVLSLDGGKKALHTFASLGGGLYLAVRGDGVFARLDATTGREVWRIPAVGLGDIKASN